MTDTEIRAISEQVAREVQIDIIAHLIATWIGLVVLLGGGWLVWFLVKRLYRRWKSRCN